MSSKYNFLAIRTVNLHQLLQSYYDFVLYKNDLLLLTAEHQKQFVLFLLLIHILEKVVDQVLFPCSSQLMFVLSGQIQKRHDSRTLALLEQQNEVYRLFPSIRMHKVLHVPVLPLVDSSLSPPCFLLPHQHQ